ncbi:transposase (plasmid) [Microvirga ossetica]|uniref:Transposase n=1 Tax=Microvirga ossetica TaxID=1882682 RepID=A0A1B2ESV7_9HYPH|nr:IS1380 family transposase [Microvirga ossetica]ANY83066.1 transposase [Microvirga ossetica]
MDDTAGEADGAALRVAFDPRLKLEFHGSKVTSDAGLLPFRDLDDALGLTDLAGEVLADPRTGQNSRHTLIAQLRQSVFGRLAGYEDVNDAERLGRDPAMRWVVGGRAVTQNAASASQMGRFETEVLVQVANLSALTDLSGRWIDAVHARRPVNGIVLDMDSSVSPTYGEQEGSAYNGHFGCTCYHLLFVFNQFGDLERCALRPGNVHSAEGWREVLEPVVARYRSMMKRRYFRADAAFASPEVYEFLEAEGYGYAIRLPANAVLQRRIAHLLTRPVGRPPHEVRRFYASFRYQAQTWSQLRRVVAKVEWHPGELYPRVGFLVTNLSRPPERVVAFYNQRGTAEQWIKEGKNAVRWTRLSCRSMTANAVRLQLHALAYNLANIFRTLVLPEEIERWSLTSLRDKVVKIGAKVITHARYTVFQMAEVAVPRELFRRILDLIDGLRPRRIARC